MKSLYISIYLVFLISLLSASETERGLASVVKQLDSNLSLGTQYLLIIGIGQYLHWPVLQHPARDAREIREILETRYFIDKTIELYDQEATKRNIIKELNALKSTLTPEDSLMIFYAGHGYSQEGNSSAYWMAADAGLDKVEKKNWISSYELMDSLTAMEASHICLLVDACFSGAFLNTSREEIPIPDPSNIPYFRKAYQLTSRQVITSGAMESVPDVSEFAQQLKMALKKNNTAFLDPLTLYDQVRLGIYKTLPLCGPLKEAGHQEGAAFLLFLKDRLGVIKITTSEKGLLTIDSQQNKFSEAGEWLLQNLEEGEHQLNLITPDGREAMATITVKPGEIINLSLTPPRPAIPAWNLGFSLAGGFPLHANIAGPSLAADINGAFTVYRQKDYSLAVQTGFSASYDSLNSSYGFTNHLLFIGPELGVTGYWVPMFAKENLASGTLGTGLGFTGNLYDNFEDQWYLTPTPYVLADIQWQLKITEFFLISIKSTYLGIFYRDFYNKLFFGLSFGFGKY
ncbi:MAG: caspase family protein [Spirochaetales bacterium]|nr:caspase family protein [Spirochaetales bacterium]